jgi:hypothetical protein
MEIQEGLDIVRKLANGVHPETGEMVTSDSRYQHPKAVRALHCATVGLEFQQERERTRRFLPANAGKTWSDQEDAQICDELRRGINFEGIAKAHNHRAASSYGKDIRRAARRQDRMNMIARRIAVIVLACIAMGR